MTTISAPVNPRLAMKPRLLSCYCSALLRKVIQTILPAALLAAGASTLAKEQSPVPPSSLHDTGLYSARGALEVDPDHIPFSPQYPLWTDGAAKRRWLSLPAGEAIDASDPDAWNFPIGTRLWKEFAFDGRPAETRYMARLPSGEWLYATYVWNDEGTGASLAPVDGATWTLASDGRPPHRIPSVSDCRACHGGRPEAVLGFNALQLSDERDPEALHAEALPPDAMSLSALVAAGLLAGWSDDLDTAPRIAAASPTERSAIGYLVGNCGSCHNGRGPLASLDLRLEHDMTATTAPVIETALGRPAQRPFAALPKGALRIAPGAPEASVLFHRLAGANPYTRMPPLGTAIVDLEAVALIERWIAEMTLTLAEIPRAHQGD